MVLPSKVLQSTGKETPKLIISGQMCWIIEPSASNRPNFRMPQGSFTEEMIFNLALEIVNFPERRKASQTEGDYHKYKYVQ